MQLGFLTPCHISKLRVWTPLFCSLSKHLHQDDTNRASLRPYAKFFPMAYQIPRYSMNEPQILRHRRVTSTNQFTIRNDGVILSFFITLTWMQINLHITWPNLFCPTVSKREIGVISTGRDFMTFVNGFQKSRYTDWGPNSHTIQLLDPTLLRCSHHK